MIRTSAFPVFRISGFLHFQFTCLPAFEVVALKCSDSRVNYHLWKVVLPSYLARNVTVSPVWSFGLSTLSYVLIDISLLPTFHFLPPRYIFAPISLSSPLFRTISPYLPPLSSQLSSEGGKGIFIFSYTMAKACRRIEKR